MECWKSKFKDKILQNGLKHKDNITDTYYDGYTFTAKVKSYDVELIIQDNTLFDMTCSCSRKSPCAHEAGVLYFLEEFPEILDDFEDDTSEKIKDISINNDLKIISDGKLKKFIKAEFRKNPKLKYNFIKFIEEESLIDKKDFENKLEKILKRGKESEFGYHGYYTLENIGSDLKKFMKKDIRLIIDQGEYKFTYKMINEIMDIFMEEIYWDMNHWYGLAYYYHEYAYELIDKNVLTDNEKEHMMKHLRIINDRAF